MRCHWQHSSRCGRKKCAVPSSGSNSRNSNGFNSRAATSRVSVKEKSSRIHFSSVCCVGHPVASSGCYLWVPRGGRRCRFLFSSSAHTPQGKASATTEAGGREEMWEGELINKQKNWLTWKSHLLLRHIPLIIFVFIELSLAVLHEGFALCSSSGELETSCASYMPILVMDNGQPFFALANPG